MAEFHQVKRTEVLVRTEQAYVWFIVNVNQNGYVVVTPRRDGKCKMEPPPKRQGRHFVVHSYTEWQKIVKIYEQSGLGLGCQFDVYMRSLRYHVD